MEDTQETLDSAPAKQNKPDLSLLKDAVEKNDLGMLEFKVEPGEQVIIERYSILLSDHPWLDTQLYVVKSVDQASGHLELFNEEYQQNASSNFLAGTEHGYKFKIPAKSGKVPKRRIKRAKIQLTQEKPQVAKTLKKERRIYCVRNVIHTRVKGIAYVAPDDTRAKAGDRFVVETSDTQATISPADNSWQETWHRDDSV